MLEAHTEITLKNGGDVATAGRGLIKKTEIRQVTPDAVVDTGAWRPVTNDGIRPGAIPLEGPDIVVNPRRGEVVGRHGDRVVHRLK
jgi:hypothetical protein